MLHGTPVADPYRWLEDADDPAVTAWVDAQNAHTDLVLARSRRRDHFRDRALDLLRLPSSGGPAIGGDLVFTLDRRDGRDQSVLVSRSRSEPGPAHVVVDPVAATDDETGAVDWFAPSRDGSLVAVGLSTGGDERSTLHVVETDGGRVVDGPIPYARAASVGWWPDGDGFAYTRYPTPGTAPAGREAYGRHVREHTLGEAADGDPVLFDPAADAPGLDDTAWPDIDVSRDGRWALVHVAVGWSRTDVFLLDRRSGRRATVIAGIEARSGFEVDGDRLVGVTTLGADRGRVVEAPLSDPGPARWRTLVDEQEDAVLEAAVARGDGLLVWSSVDAVARLDDHDRDGTHRGAVALPELGAVVGLDAEPGRDDAFVTLTSFARPPSLFGLDEATRLRPWSDAGGDLDSDRYRVTQTTYRSSDGTEIPVFLVHGRDHPPGPSTRCILTGYGGFAIANAPAFSPLAVTWCDDGGLLAVAGLRGGGERGEAWHEAGSRAHKRTVFDDFESAADWLVDRRLTERDRLAVRGGSNGGLLVGAAVTRRPALCAAAHAAVPLMDMVRYPRFEIARLWMPEYGDPEDPEEFAWLVDYSPYHRVIDGDCYPAALLSAGAGDSRVDPMHARKMAARLQAATGCGRDRPILLRQEARAGHGQGKPVGRQADETADVLAFFDQTLAGGEPPS